MHQTIYLFEEREADRTRVKMALDEMTSSAFIVREFVCSDDLHSGLRSETPDLLILGLDIDGSQGIGLLKVIAPDGTPPCPIVALCVSDCTPALEAGAHDTLLKERLSSPLLAKALRFAGDRFRLQAQLRSSRQDLEELNKELRRKDQAKVKFVASLSHELRTPVTGMMGLLSLMRSTDLNSDQQSLAESLTNCCNSLLLTVDDVIDMSTIECGELKAKSLPFHLRAHLESALDPMRIQALDKNLEIHLLLDPGLPDFVVGDPGRLRQVLSSLVGNGIKFTQKGAVTVTAKPDAVGLRFEIEDTGIGIEQYQVSRLFEPYYQAESRDSSDLGRGLGLAISSSIVDSLGGQIGVESALGQGSTFWFTLPFAQGGSATAYPGFSGVPRTVRSLSLLVAEDNPIVSRIIKVQLQDLGHNVHLVADGHEAVSACAEHSFDIIVMDCQMPHLDGYDATRAIRKLKRFHKTPVIALTAQAFTGEREKCLEAGMSDYLVKPVTPYELQARFDAHLNTQGHGMS